MKKKKLIKIGIIMLFVLMIGTLIFQYVSLFGLRDDSRELQAQLNNLNEQIERVENQIEEYENLIDNDLLLEDYAEHNGYYNTDEVYLIN